LVFEDLDAFVPPKEVKDCVSLVRQGLELQEKRTNVRREVGSIMSEKGESITVVSSLTIRARRAN
jgi:hypothetical protein